MHCSVRPGHQALGCFRDGRIRPETIAEKIRQHLLDPFFTAHVLEYPAPDGVWVELRDALGRHSDLLDDLLHVDQPPGTDSQQQVNGLLPSRQLGGQDRGPPTM